jgi:4'-phosphopantetheinyl transferase
LITRALIRYALSYYVDVAPLEWEFIKNQYGRPQLTPRFAGFNLNFNITHSQGAVACLIACGHQVGVDIEPQNRHADFFDFADTVLTPFEQAALDQNFLRYWTLKEAYSKALGLGLAIDFKNIVCVFGEEDCSTLEGYTELSKESWQFIQTPILDSYLLAIAIKKAQAEDVAIRLMKYDDEFNHVESGHILKNMFEPVSKLLVK